MKSLLCLCVAICLFAGCKPAHRTIQLGDYRDMSKEDMSREGRRPVSATRPVLMYFEEGEHKFDALVGPSFNRERPANGEAFIQNSFSRYYLDGGWVYMAGSYPFVETSVVATIADGTTYAVQIDGAIQRVYLLSTGAKDKVKISLKPGIPAGPGPTTIWLKEQRFAVIKADGAGKYSIVDTDKIKGNGDVKPFIENLKEAVKNAGLLPTWPGNLP